MPMSQEEQQVESAVLQTQPADRPDGALSPKDAATVKKLRQTIHELHLELEELEERNDGQERELKLIADRALREEAHTRQLRTQLEAAKAAHDESSERAEDAMAMVRSLEAKVEALREAEYVAAGDLRGQLDAARAAAAATHEADVSRLRLAHGRQAELEIQNAQMSKELAAMQKELDAANSTVEMYAQEAQQAAIPPAAEELT
jgi:chromosome segregation ATPase